MLHHRPRRYLAPILGACLLVALLLGAIPLTIFGIQQRVIAPPTFAFQIGDIEFAAPCPTRGFVCHQPMPWYAIWRGDPEPDGSIKYQELFFIYLRPNSRR